MIALTSFKEEELVLKALQAGAISYLLKNVSADELASDPCRARRSRHLFAGSCPGARLRRYPASTAWA